MPDTVAESQAATGGAQHATGDPAAKIVSAFHATNSSHLPMPPGTLPTDDTLIQIAGAATFKRAQGYAASGAVDITRSTETTIEAEVTGQDEYRVKLSRLDFVE